MSVRSEVKEKRCEREEMGERREVAVREMLCFTIEMMRQKVR